MLSPLRLALVLIIVCSSTACVQQGTAVSQSPNHQVYGTLPDGQTAHLFTLTNANGLTATLTDFGATLVSLKTPDRDGNLADVTIGYDTLDGWVNDTSYMGATVGRYGNRIANGTFNLDGNEYTLATNNAPNHLHGGDVGFNKKLWQAKPFTKDTGCGVAFTYVSPDGEEGYPGQLTAIVTYFLDHDDQLTITFKATTDAPTVVNLVHHTYWNLTGDPSQTILDHKLMLLADGYTPIDQTSIPNNAVQPVADTPFDFRSATAIGERINDDNQQLEHGKGYDHSWAINGEAGELRIAAVLYDPGSGRIMHIKTDQPAIQFYSGNFMDGSTTGKGDIPHNARTGLCLETQVFPDSPNQPELSDAVLRPGETYTHTMVHAFKTK